MMTLRMKTETQTDVFELPNISRQQQECSEDQSAPKILKHWKAAWKFGKCDTHP